VLQARNFVMVEIMVAQITAAMLDIAKNGC